MASNGSTKEELQSQIEALKNQVTDLQDQIARRDAADNAGDDGWMISTPNPNYNGRTLNVLFEHGHGFVPAKWPNAEKLVLLLTKDFGYSATRTQSGREVKPAAVAADQRSLSQKLMRPHEMGKG